MRLMSIASGSSGNCIYAGSGNTHLIIDAGLSGKKIENGLKEIGLRTADMDGVLVTHEHSDHIQGLGVISRRYHLPIYATAGTIEAIMSSGTCGKIDPALFHEISADRNFMLKDIEVGPFRISHDAAEPVAYRLTEKVCESGLSGDAPAVINKEERVSAAVCTDLGKYDDYIMEHLRGVSILLLESNHDVNMLEVGPYPYYLKQRILGEKGHLSNETAGELLSKVITDSMKAVLLGHLSHENNFTELAYETVKQELLMRHPELSDRKFSMEVALRDRCSQLIQVS